MGLADFKNSKNLATALTNSASNADEVHFPTDSQAIVHKGKKYGVPAIAGKLNLTSSTDVDNALKSLKSTNEVAFFLVTDSSGKIPSSQSAYDVPASILKKMSLTSPNATTNALLSVATASVSLSAIGVNVGDLIALTRVMVKVSDLTSALGISLSLSGEIEMYQYKILAMNDAKATNHSYTSAGVMGLMSPWDKGQVNKIGTIESNLATASSELNRGNKKTMFTADNYNIDQCLDGGIYLYGRTGRSMAGNHSDEFYIVSVDTRYNRSDSKYYVTQRVYSVNYKNRAFERLIVTSATNNYNGTYNNWVQLSEEQYMSESDVNDFVTIRNWYNSVVGTDSDAVINKYQEIVDFLANIPEGDTLNGIITALETAIDNQTAQHQTDIGNINSEITKIKNGTTTVGASKNAQIAEQATKDGNGKVIATTYLTKTDASNTYATKNVATTSANGLMSTDMVKKVDNIQLTDDKILPVLLMKQEAIDHQVLIPYMQNDIAYPIARGGYIKVTVDGVEKTGITDVICNGMPDYNYSVFGNLTTSSVVTVEIDAVTTLYNSQYAFIVFSASWLVPTNIMLEAKTLDTDEWTTIKAITDNTSPCFACSLDTNGTIGYRYLKYTITGCPSSQLRLTEIGVAAYNSAGLNNIVLSKGGGEVYGNIAPYKDNKQYLGTSSKAWLVVNAYNLLIKKADGNRGKICGSGNNIVVYTNESDNTKVFVFDEDNYSFRRGFYAPDMILGTSTYPWKNVYGKQLTSTAAEGTAPLVVSSKTMVANLNAQYAGMLFSSSNAPVNAGNALKPVYFNGGVPVACDMSASGNRWGVLTFVDSTGYFQIGKYLTFSVSDTKVNADVIVTARDANDVDGAGLNINGTTIASGKFGQHSGYIGTDISGLSSYWCKLWELNYKISNNDIDATIYLHSAYDDFRGIVHVRVRWVRKTNDDGTYTEGTHLVFIKQVVGNIPIDRIRLYYKCDINASTGAITNGQIEIWGNVYHQYGVINAVLLSLTQRRAAESTNYYGTFAKNNFTTVQTPTLPNYVDMTNVTISQTAAKATNAQFAEIVKSVTTPTANNCTLQYVSGGITKGDAAGNAKEGSNADPNLWSYPEGGTSASDTTANIQTLRLKWSNVYFHDIFVSPNQKTIWHRWVYNGTAKDWMKIVEANADDELSGVKINSTTWDKALRIKNADYVNQETKIYNAAQGTTVIRHTDENGTNTDLRFKLGSITFEGKQLAYLTDVTNHKPKTLAVGGYINTIMEDSSDGKQFIPMLQNDIAYFIEQGGDVTCTIDGVDFALSDTTKTHLANGSGTHINFNTTDIPSATSVVVLTLSLPMNFAYSNTIYIASPAVWRAKDTKVEVYAPSLNEWATVWDRVNQGSGFQYLNWNTNFSDGKRSTTWNKIRITLTNFHATDIRLRIDEIGVIKYASENSRAICLPRNGGEIYGGITPFNNSSYNLGSNSKKWKKIYADNFEGLASKATADASGNNIADTYATKAALAIVSNNADKANNLLEKITGGIATVPKAASAESATNATNDVNGNKIDETYALRGTGIATTSELSKYVSINKHYFGTLLLPIVTTDSAGAMSANDKNTLDDIPNIYATKTEVSTTAAGLMSAADKEKLDGIAAGANKYSLPVATSTTRGGVKIGYTRSGNNFGVALSSEKMYVNIPNATQSLAGLLSADDKVKVDSITSMQGTLESLETSVAGKTSAIDVTALMAENGTLYGVTLQDLAMSNLYVVSEGYCQAKYYGYSAESSYLAFHPTDGYIIAEGIVYVGSSIEKRLFVSRVEQTNTGVTCTSYETRVVYM